MKNDNRKLFIRLLQKGSAGSLGPAMNGLKTVHYHNNILFKVDSFIISLILFSIIMLFDNCSSTENIIKNNDDSGKQQLNIFSNKDTSNISFIGEVILIYTTESCECILQACEKLRERIPLIINVYTNQKNVSIKYTTINYAFEPDKAEPLMKQYDLCFFPSVILSDKNRKILYKEPFEFNEKKFKTELKNLIDKQKKR